MRRYALACALSVVAVTWVHHRVSVVALPVDDVDDAVCAILQRNATDRRHDLELLKAEVPDTVPEDVKCEKIKHCDRHNVCVVTCKRGSVHMDTWLQNALRVQRQLAYGRTLCSAQLPGTHNSAITMADGYGAEDHVFEGYLRYISWLKHGLHVHTNDQLFSLTDQLQMGVRFIELDVHWFDNDLRIAHCGGFHSKLLDEFVSVINRVARALGSDIQWDSETIGCKPSMSSIPADQQRHLNDALKEVAAWLHNDANKDEFLMLFIDDETNLFRWKKVQTLVKYLEANFKKEEVLIPGDMARYKGWPTLRELIDSGKRIMVMSGADYSARAGDVLFVKGNVCHWYEPSLPFEAYPACRFVPSGRGPLDVKETIFRPETSEIEYAFLNADGHFGRNEHLLDEKSIPPIVQCGVNIPSPDNVTPKRMESMVWAFSRSSELEPGKCVALMRGAPHWQSVDCSAPGFVAGCVSSTDIHRWQLGSDSIPERFANESCAKLSASFKYEAPASGYENHILHHQLQFAPSTILGVWINAKDLLHHIWFSQPANDSTAHRITSLTAIE